MVAYEHDQNYIHDRQLNRVNGVNLNEVTNV